MIVVDANILAFYVIEGQRTIEANALRERDAEWIVPDFWRIEFQSILWKHSRIGGLPAGKAAELLDQALTMFSANEVTPSPAIVLRDALRWGITVYDAQYVSLASQFGIFCVTEDMPVQHACPQVAISLNDFLKRGAAPTGVREKRATYGAKRK